MTDQIPAPPPGFTLRQTAPPPPPGFQIRQQASPTPEPEGPGFVERAVGAVKAIPGAVSSLVTGEGRREFDYPELPGWLQQQPSDGRGSPSITDRLSLGRDDLRKLDILRQAVGDVPAQIDAFGNVYVSLGEADLQPFQEPGGEPIRPGNYYINRPGVSRQDMADLTTMATFEGAGALPAGRVAAPLLRLGAMGAGTAAGSVAQDVAASKAGSTRGVDTTAALVAGAFGIGGDVAGMVAAPFLRRIFSSGRHVTPEGQLTPAGRSAMETAGLDPDKATPEFVQSFAAAVANEPAGHAAVRATGESLPSPVPLSRGDITRNPADMQDEDLLLAQPSGTSAGDQMRTFRTRQQDALRANVPAIQDAISGGARQVQNPGEGMRQVQETISGQYQAGLAQSDEAYRAARAAGRATAPAQTVGDLRRQMRSMYQERFRGAFPEDSAPVRLMRQLQLPEGATGVTIQSMEDWVQRVNRASRGLPRGSPERAALGEMKEAYETWRDNAIDQAIITGDQDALDLWREARDTRRIVNQTFERDAIIQNIIRRTPGDNPALELTPNEAMNLIMTASGTGAQRNAVQAVRQIKTILGEGSPEWNALREEAFLRLLRNQPINRLDENLTQEFSGDAFNTAFRRQMRDNSGLMRALFTEDELNTMNQLREVALRVTNAPRSRMNPSGSGDRVAALTRSLAGSGIIGQGAYAVIGKALGWVGTGADSFRAGQAIRGVVPRGPGSPVAGGVGATTGAATQTRNPELVEDRQ